MAQRCLCCMQMMEGGNCPHCGYPSIPNNQSHQLPVGSLLHGRYQIGRVLGQGGFGITYLAWDTALNNPVAIKEFYPNGIVYRRNNGSFRVECSTSGMIPHYEYSRERFLREARALVEVRNVPVVVNILDFIEENNTAYIVMEYVRGVQLAKYVQRKGGRLNVDETFRILKPIMAALAKVHKAGIVHRDISPDNIILDPMGGPRLLDFGAVRKVENPDVDKALTKSTEAILKHGFAPLEQYNSRGSLGPWTDEYAMCATVWYCLTGRIPDEASVRMMEGTHPKWNMIPGLPEHQQIALEKGIACKAKDRFPDMDGLLAALFPEDYQEIPLGRASSTQELNKTPEVLNTPVQPPAEDPKPRKKWVRFLWIPAVAIVLAIAAAIVFWPKGTEPDNEVISDYSEDDDDQDRSDPDTPLSQEARQEQDYQKAEELLAQGKYQEAIDLYTNLGDYKDSPQKCEYAQAGLLVQEGKLGEAAIRYGKLGDFSDAKELSLSLWDQFAVRDTVSAGDCHSVGVLSNGTAVAAGIRGWNYHDQCEVNSWEHIIAVSAGGYHTLGLTDAGTVMATGYNASGQIDVNDWSGIVAVSAGHYHSVGLKLDGTVIAAGDSGCDVGQWTDIVAISAGGYHTLGLKADGTVVAVGNNDKGQCNVSEWTDIIAIGAGYNHSVGLKADGTVVTAGNNQEGQRNTQGWKNIVAISAGRSHTVGLKADGTVVAEGDNSKRQCNVTGWKGILSVSAGNAHSLGLNADGTVVPIGYNGDGQLAVEGWKDIMLPTERVPFR